MVQVFAVPVFFICFRECLETVIICSVLLSFLKQTLGPERDPVVYKKLRRQIWYGIAAGLLLCLIIGGALIGAFYGYGQDYFSNGIEDIWEGAFSIVASIIITVMGAALLRVSKLQDKWRVKLARALEAKESGTRSWRTWKRGSLKRWSEKYAMFLLPFITVLREGLEAVVFIGGVSLGLPATAFPLAVICGIGVGLIIGYLIYKSGNLASLQIFLIISTCFLYLVAAGLMSKGVWSLENHAWNQIVGGDASEVGSGAGSYDIRQSVWHVNCCNPEINGGGGWGIFNALFGWQNSATYGSVISYNLYWIVVSAGFLVMLYNEKQDHLPFVRAAPAAPAATSETTSNSGAVTELGGEKKEGVQTETRHVPELMETPGREQPKAM